MFKILNELIEIHINDRLIPADKITRGGHNQAFNGLMLGQSFRRWANVNPTLVQRPTLAGSVVK